MWHMPSLEQTNSEFRKKTHKNVTHSVYSILVIRYSAAQGSDSWQYMFYLGLRIGA